MFDSLTKSYINFALPSDVMNDSARQVAWSMLSRIHRFSPGVGPEQVFSQYGFTLSVDNDVIVESLHALGIEVVTASTVELALNKYLGLLAVIGFEFEHVAADQMIRRLRTGSWEPI